MGLFDGGCVGGLGDGEDFVVALGLVHGSCVVLLWYS